MSTILNIDTSTETASVSIAVDGSIQASVINPVQKEHASFLHIAIKELLKKLSLRADQIDAVATTNGPGSYTGLRVGMSSAKGFCYALNKPLITIGTLNAMAEAAIILSKISESNSSLFCPMIDARRQEVYTALFNADMLEILPACAMILNESSFEHQLVGNQVSFFGSGAFKWGKMTKSPNAQFINEIDISASIAQLSFKKFQDKNFTDLSYSEPLYVKEFFSP